MTEDFRYGIKKSKIAGNGVFARVKIKRNQTICFLKGKLLTLEEMVMIVNEGKEAPSDPLGVGDGEYLDLDEIFRTFNHSYDPNSFIQGRNELVTMRNINEGEEITYDYSTTMDEDKEKTEKAGGKLWACECNCGGKNCRGAIVQLRTLPENRLAPI